jgi:hypothetical protein
MSEDERVRKRERERATLARLQTHPRSRPPPPPPRSLSLSRARSLALSLGAKLEKHATPLKVGTAQHSELLLVSELLRVSQDSYARRHVCT